MLITAPFTTIINRNSPKVYQLKKIKRGTLSHKISIDKKKNQEILTHAKTGLTSKLPC